MADQVVMTRTPGPVQEPPAEGGGGMGGAFGTAMAGAQQAAELAQALIGLAGGRGGAPTTPPATPPAAPGAYPPAAPMAPPMAPPSAPGPGAYPPAAPMAPPMAPPSAPGPGAYPPAAPMAPPTAFPGEPVVPAYRATQGDPAKFAQGQEAIDTFMNVFDHLPIPQVQAILGPMIMAASPRIGQWLMTLIRGDEDAPGPDYSDITRLSAVACGYIVKELEDPVRKALEAWQCGLMSPIGLGSGKEGDLSNQVFLAIQLSHSPTPRQEHAHSCGHGCSC